MVRKASTSSLPKPSLMPSAALEKAAKSIYENQPGDDQFDLEPYETIPEALKWGWRRYAQGVLEAALEPDPQVVEAVGSMIGLINKEDRDWLAVAILAAQRRAILGD